MTKYKVFNNNDFNVGIKLENPSRDINIRANTFVLLEEDAILYTNSVSSLFEKGILYVEDIDMLHKMGYTEQNPNTISKKEALEILKLPNMQLKREISKITENHAKSKILEAISSGEVDLSQSAIKIISDALNVDVLEIIQTSEL